MNNRRPKDQVRQLVQIAGKFQQRLHFSWILSLAGGERQVGTRGTFRRAYLVNAGVSTRRYF